MSKITTKEEKEANQDLFFGYYVLRPLKALRKQKEDAESDNALNEQLDLQRKRNKQLKERAEREAELEAGPVRQSTEWQEFVKRNEQLSEAERNVDAVKYKIQSTNEEEIKLNLESKQIGRELAGGKIDPEKLRRANHIDNRLTDLKSERYEAAQAIPKLYEEREQAVIRLVESYQQLHRFIEKKILPERLRRVMKAEQEYAESLQDIKFVFDSIAPLDAVALNTKFDPPVRIGSPLKWPGIDKKGKADVLKPCVSEFIDYKLNDLKNSHPVKLDQTEYTKHVRNK